MHMIIKRRIYLQGLRRREMPSMNTIAEGRNSHKINQNGKIYNNHNH